MPDRRIAPLVGIIAHDAGGAEILASYILQEGLNCLFVLAGPAEEIFRIKLGAVEVVDLETAIQGADWLLTGTGWQTDWEWRAICEAQSAGKHIVAFLDHWTNYKGRFVRGGVKCLPNEIWVGDQHAYALARHTFPEISIRLVENPYFKEFSRLFEDVGVSQGLTLKNKCNVLYVCENHNEGQFSQHPIRFLMSSHKTLGIDIARLVIRPHPSETANKYSWACKEFDCDVSVSNGRTLFDDIVESDVVAGCSSMAMVLGLIARRRVISCIPNNEIRLTLPFKEIEVLSDILRRGGNGGE